jgi:hypothetical protein
MAFELIILDEDKREALGFVRDVEMAHKVKRYMPIPSVYCVDEERDVLLIHTGIGGSRFELHWKGKVITMSCALVGYVDDPSSKGGAYEQREVHVLRMPESLTSQTEEIKMLLQESFVEFGNGSNQVKDQIGGMLVFKDDLRIVATPNTLSEAKVADILSQRQTH